jgi:uncharacterized protein YukE
MTNRAVADSVAEGYQAILRELTAMEEALGRHCEGLSAGSWRPTAGECAAALQGLADQVTTTRRAVEALQEAQREERRRLGHDIRGAVNAIAGWTHILRLERNPSERVARATDVLDRNVRTLAGVIESVDR